MGKAREREVLSWWKTSIMPSVVSSEMKEGEGLEKGVIALMEFFLCPHETSHDGKGRDQKEGQSGGVQAS